MMTPARWARITGSTCLQAMIAPRRLMAAMRSNAASVISVERRVAAGDAHTDIVVQDVDAAPALLRGLGHRGERRLLGDVGLERHAFSARLPRHRHRFLGGGEVVVDGQHLGALLGESAAPWRDRCPCPSPGDWPAPTTMATLSLRRMETSMKQHEKPRFHISADSDQIDCHCCR